MPPRAFQIRKEDAEVHGLGRQPHTSECSADVMKEDARYQNSEKRKQEFEDRMREKTARYQARKHPAASGSGGHGYRERRILSRYKPQWIWTTNTQGLIRKREEEEGTTAMQEADPGGEMTAELGTKSDAMNVAQQEQEVLKHVAEIFVGSEADDDGQSGWAWDDVHGKCLDLSQVREARQQELEYMKLKGIWAKVDRDESYSKTGKKPVSVKWVDTNKGSDEVPVIRSRLVARDIREKGDKDRQDLIAATLPLELKRMMLSKAASLHRSGKRRKLLFIDVQKAHLNPVRDQDVYFDLPEEANPQPGKVGKLYGFRLPAQAWENCYAAKFVEEANFERGIGSSVSFWQKSRDLACVVHGDDFTFCGFNEELDWIENLMMSWFEVKVRARLWDPTKTMTLK